MSSDVVVIGAGIAGLTTAHELVRNGVSVHVLEASGRAGGVILSEQLDGFTIDAGPDSLLVQKPEAIALCRELGLGDRLVSTKPPRIAYIQRNGRLHALPAASVLGIPTRVGPFVSTNLFSWPGKLRMGAELFVPARRDESDESIGAFMRRRFGQEATDYLAEPLLAGIHAGDVDRLSLKSLFPRFREAERAHGSVLRAFAVRTQTAPSSDGAFRSLPGGLSELTCALTRALGPERLLTSTRVQSIDGSGPFIVRTADGRSFEAAAVALTIPAFAAGAILQSRDPELATLCGETRYASVATVALAFDRDAVGHPLNGSGYVVPRLEKSGILAASWLSSKWPGRAPEGKVLIRAFVGGARDPEAVNGSDAELVATSIAAVRPLLQIAGKPLFTRVYRWERASAQHEVGHLDRLERIERALAHHPGLFLTGSGFRGVGIPDCVADARRTAQAIRRFLGQPDQQPPANNQQPPTNNQQP
jgi:oxygen-dependent protoporphyrinogen oxidase